MENTSPTRVPRFLWVVIVVLLASMYSYAAFFDQKGPEKIVENFFQAYYTKDYDTMASNASVFWAVQFLPQYMTMSPADLLANRDKIEKELSKAFKDAEKSNPIPKDVSVKIRKDYTKEGNYAAVVVYDLLKSSKIQGTGAAVLIKEKDQFLILSISPLDEQSLSQVKELKIEEMDASVKEVLNMK